jgi:glycosyltransferase involved in cell wall biosynthesis
MEAMACGRPVISTDAGDARFLVNDGETGFVVPKNDSAALVRRMHRLMTDSNLCVRMGTAARLKAEKEFDLRRFARKTLDAYRAAGWRDAQNERA